MNARPFTLAIALLGLLAASAGAQSEKAKGKGKPADRGAQGSSAKARGPSTDIEIRIFRDYYSAPSRKPKSLPPGIAKNLARGKPLPPGIAKKYAPDDVIVLLPARTGTRWLVVGDVVLLVDAGELIVDFFRLMF
jgi:hypothetical protein